jgi:hypothetical protein
MLAGLLPDLKSVIDRVQTLLDATAPTDDESGKARAAEMKRLYGRALAINAELLTIGEVAS